jgi:predicted anti-sigma-YlaC factor YlaD
MRCTKALRLLSLRMDVPLSAHAAEKLDLHLAGCSSCRLAAEGFERTWEALESVATPGPAPDDWMSIETAVEGRQRRWLPTWFDLDLAPTRAAVACALAVMALVGGAGGLLLEHALRTDQPVALESVMIAETLGDLPWNSPVSGLGQLLDAHGEEVHP